MTTLNKYLLFVLALVLIAADTFSPSTTGLLKADFGISAILSAVIAAAAAAAGGIASAENQRIGAEDASKNSAANRAQQMKIAKMQIGYQQDQQAKDQAMAAQQQLAGAYAQRGDMAQQLANKQVGAQGDIMSDIVRAYSRRG